MAGQRRLLWRLTTRPGMILLCPVDGADRGRMMSASIRGHGGIGVSTPCRSDRPGGSVTADRFKVVRKGYTTYAVRSVGLAGARDRNLRDQSDGCGVLERDILQQPAIAGTSQSDDDDRRCSGLFRRNFTTRSGFSEPINPFCNDFVPPHKIILSHRCRDTREVLYCNEYATKRHVIQHSRAVLRSRSWSTNRRNN